MKKVIVKPNFASLDLTTVVIADGKPKPVALCGEIRITTPPSAGGPGAEVVIPLATQEELRWLFEQGHPLLTEVEEAEAKSDKKQA